MDPNRSRWAPSPGDDDTAAWSRQPQHTLAAATSISNSSGRVHGGRGSKGHRRKNAHACVFYSFFLFNFAMDATFNFFYLLYFYICSTGNWRLKILLRSSFQSSVGCVYGLNNTSRWCITDGSIVVSGLFTASRCFASSACSSVPPSFSLTAPEADSLWHHKGRRWHLRPAALYPLDIALFLIPFQTCGRSVLAENLLYSANSKTLKLCFRHI